MGTTVRVAVASEAWPLPADTSMFTYGRDTLEALRANGVDAFPLALSSSRGARIGGLLLPLLRRTFGRYHVPSGTLVHQVTPNTLRGVDVVTIQDFSPFYETRVPDAFFRNQIRVAFRRAQRVVLTTDWSRRDAVERFPQYRDKFRVVPVPLRTPPPGIGPVEYDALWIGRSSPNKDLPLYVELAARFPTLRFAVRSSKSPGRDAYDREVRELLGRTKNVVEVPRQTEEGFDRLLRASPILVVTSRYEGFHIPAMEAYLRGAKLVLPRIEPFLEIYPNDAVFWYASAAGVEPLATAFEEARKSPFRPPDREVVDRVSLGRVGRSLKEIYSEIV